MQEKKLLEPFTDLDQDIKLTPLAIQKGKELFKLMESGEMFQ